MSEKVIHSCILNGMKTRTKSISVSMVFPLRKQYLCSMMMRHWSLMIQIIPISKNVLSFSA